MPVEKLIINSESGNISRHDFANCTVCWYSNRSPDKDGSNEDALLMAERDDGIVLLAVADGVGGQPGGAQAANLALKALSRQAINNTGNDAMSDIITGIDAANKAVMDMQTGSATTLAAAMIDKQQARTFHIGDSEIFICGQRGKIKLQTIPHSPTGYAVESGILSEDEALMHEDRYLVSNLVGNMEMRIELGSITRLAVHDTLFLCTDGITDNLVADEIINLIRKGSIENAAINLLSAVTSRMQADDGKPDDCSFILYRNKTG